MSYRIYSTRAFILSSAPSGETSKTYLLYTQDFGLIRARAQGVRSLASKLRYNLSDYGFVTVSLVRGKELWRLTGAVSESTDQSSDVTAIIAGKIHPELARVRARILNLIKRLVHGEEQNSILFGVLVTLFNKESTALSEREDVLALETLTLAHVLKALGYIDADALLGDQSLEHIKSKKREIVGAINKALQETQL